MNLGSLEVPQERKSAMFFATLFWREPDLQIYNRAQWFSRSQNKQDACRGVHSACRREINRHKLDICVLRLRQGRIQAISYVGQNFLVLKWGEGLD